MDTCGLAELKDCSHPGEMEKVRDLETSGLIQQRGLVTDTTAPFRLDVGRELQILAPGEAELEGFIRTLVDDNLDFKKQPDANWLSVLCMVHWASGYLLLTSDSVIAAQRRVSLKRLRKESRKLVLGQVPHHGSANNYEKEFWKRLLHDRSTPAAVSVGPNQFGHPSPDVEVSLGSLGYRVMRTGLNRQVSSLKPNQSSLNVVSVVRRIQVAARHDLTFSFP